MNERIKELLWQVGGHDTKALMHPDDIEKFAELIIKECASLIQSTHTNQLFADVSYDRGYFDGRNDGACMIKQYFGVE